MEELRKHGASPDTRDYYGNSPLDFLISHCKDETQMKAIEYLVEDCHVFLDGKNDHGMTALHLATLTGNKDLVMYLIENRGDLNVMDSKGE